MISQKTRPKRVSTAASTTFEAAVSQRFPLLDFKAWRADLEETPLLQDFAGYWKGKLGEDEAAQELLKTIPGLADQYPLDGERQHFSKPSATYIQDIKKFKERLQVSVDPSPLVEWNDLPVARV